MPHYHQKLSLSGQPSRITPSTAVQRDEIDPQKLQRFLQNPTSSPQLMRAAQKQLGNQGLQRLMRQTHTKAETVNKPLTIQRAAVIQHRAGHGALQRGPLSWIKNKFKKWVNKQATEGTFGSDTTRQADPSENYLDVRDQNTHSFSDIQSIDIKSGPKQEHTLKGRHYFAKDPSKGPYAGKTVLFLSGSAGVAENYSKESALYYCAQGANLLAVNYRGFGRSKTSDDKGQNRKMGHNELTDTMLYEDSRAMFNWLTGNGVAADQVIVHGYSLGGAMAANLVSALANDGIRVAGLVFHSAIDSARKVAVRDKGKILGNLGADNLGSEFDTIGAMKALAKDHPEMLDLPIAAISGAHDQGDHLDDKTTNLSGQMEEMGFSNVGSLSRHDKSHTPDHLKNLKVQDLVKEQLGTVPQKKEEPEIVKVV